MTVILDLDKSQRTERYRSADFLADAGIPTYIDAQHAIAHNKVMLIDGTALVIGSFNFTGGPRRKNAEKVLVLRGIRSSCNATERTSRLHRSTHSRIENS